MSSGWHRRAGDRIVAHPRTTSLTVSVALGVAIFAIFGGFATGWGNVLAASAFAFGIWVGATLILRMFGNPR
jgi:hypothetical protein